MENGEKREGEGLLSSTFTESNLNNSVGQVPPAAPSPFPQRYKAFPYINVKLHLLSLTQDMMHNVQK